MYLLFHIYLRLIQGERFQEVFKEHMLSSAGSTAEEVLAKLKTGLLKTTGEVCGLWSDKIEGAIAAKRQAFKA